MSKLYKIDGLEYISKDYFVLPDGRPHSGKTFTAESVRLFTEADRGVKAVAHVPEKRVQKVKTKNTPTSLRKLKEEENGG
jgi:hypothetical protein